MSDAIELTQNASEHVECLLAEMFEGNHDNNHMLLGSLNSGDDQIQVQLIVTRNTEEFLDEQ